MPNKLRLATAVSILVSSVTSAQAARLVADEALFPETDSDKRDILSSEQMRVNGRYRPTGFKTLLRSGDQLQKLGGAPGEMATYAEVYDIDGNPLFVSNDNDFNSLIKGEDDNLYLISHFEARPGAMYQTLLGQAADGELIPQATRAIDFSAVHGGWVHCAGSVTPWDTHLGSEEYEPDARSWVDPNLPISDYTAAMAAYFGVEGTPENAATTMNPYHYGYAVEVKVNASGEAEVSKHYAMGRSALELAYVMPDRKTVYLTDDGTNVGLYMFLADNEGDLSAGTLYAAKWNQLSGAGMGKARLSWIYLGHASAAEVKAASDDPSTTFSKIFDFGDTLGEGCVDAGLNSINSGHGSPYHECLALTGNVSEAVASRLELRRFAALKGATTEWRKMEGITFAPERRTLYLAMSEINNGMLNKAAATSRHEGGNDHIQVARNDCGGVYAMRVGGRVRDDNGELIGSRYVARTMDGEVAGTPISGDPNNSCAVDGLANPDNLSYLPRYNALVIGEDTGSGHQNDAVWLYNILNKDLTRIQTTPYGSETTSVYWYPNLNGHGYPMSVVQHPYGESDSDKADADADKRGYVGYFQFPQLAR